MHHSKPAQPAINKREVNRRSNRKGSMLVLVTVFLAFLTGMLIFFFMHMTRVLGSHNQQTTAIDAAALAAAAALSSIVVEDDYFGFVALSDFAPNRKGTLAKDNYPLSVTGINTLFATIRLELIIADQLKDPIITRAATEDFNRAIKTRDKLIATLNKAIQPGMALPDADGNLIDLTAIAEDLYNRNRINMAGGKSNLVPGSLKLTLGYIPTLPSNTRIPNPSKYAQIQANQQEFNCYKANQSIQYAGMHFVFASLADSTRLVSGKEFSTTLNGSNGIVSIPTIIRCEADQSFSENVAMNQSVKRTVHVAAHAEPGAFIDTRPAPGALSLSLPDGEIPEIATLGALFTVPDILKCPTDKIESPSQGDYPPNPLQMVKLPVLLYQRPLFHEVWSLAFHDWLRRLGPNVDVQSLLDTLNAPLTHKGAAGQMHLFEPDSKGVINYSVKPMAADPSLPISHKQWRAASGLAIDSSNGKLYDMYIRDFVYQPGRIAGGDHAGEPFPTFQTGGTNAAVVQAQLFDERTNSALTFPNGNGSVRPTYGKNGIAVDVKFRKR